MFYWFTLIQIIYFMDCEVFVDIFKSDPYFFKFDDVIWLLMTSFLLITFSFFFQKNVIYIALNETNNSWENSFLAIHSSIQLLHPSNFFIHPTSSSIQLLHSSKFFIYPTSSFIQILRPSNFFMHSTTYHFNQPKPQLGSNDRLNDSHT